MDANYSLVHFSHELFYRRRGIYHEVVQIRDNDRGHINEAYVRNMDSRPPGRFPRAWTIPFDRPVVAIFIEE
ncbi:hypothetical protein TNCT_423841 [Trichonephila clavata]|uniref:Uncharacterized protein n=1 Tax=Trichonephila clavata TaxID=2740835 RepID=A0A8X6LAQ2_TRICU|nr:hypothetical protein TNCT_423841 [Trichonephila clavata]